MFYRIWFSLVIALVLFTACSPDRGPATANEPDASQDNLPVNPYTPGKGDESLRRGEVFIDAQTILEENGFPRQYQLQVSGSLPSPCHQPCAISGEHSPG